MICSAELLAVVAQTDVAVARSIVVANGVIVKLHSLLSPGFLSDAHFPAVRAELVRLDVWSVPARLRTHNHVRL
jgi:hypothetical protein